MDEFPASSRRDGLNLARTVPRADPQLSHFHGCQPPKKGGFPFRIESNDATESDPVAKLSRGQREVEKFGKEIR